MHAPLLRRLRVLAFLLAAAQLPAAQLPAASLEIGDANGAPGATVFLPVSLSGSFAAITGIQFDLSFSSAQAVPSPAQLPAAVISAGGTPYVVASRDVQPGLRRVVVYSPSNAPLPDSLLVEIPFALTAASAAGGPTVRVSTVTVSNAAGQTQFANLRYSPVTTWRLGNFTLAELNDPAIIGDDRDPDGDGLTNLQEYFLGGRPKIGDPGLAAMQALSPSPQIGQYFFSLNFRSPRSVTGVTPSVESSTNMSTWTDLGPVSPRADLSTPDFNVFKVRVDAGASPTLFLRLKLRRN